MCIGIMHWCWELKLHVSLLYEYKLGEGGNLIWAIFLHFSGTDNDKMKIVGEISCWEKILYVGKILAKKFLYGRKILFSEKFYSLTL
jgi:hypothetical protein